MLIGSLMLLVGTLLFCKSYSDYKREGVILSKAFLDYLVHLRLGISGYSRTITEARRGFQSEPLFRCGFLPSLEEGESQLDSFLPLCKTSIPEEIKEALKEYFTLSGKRFLEDEIASVTKCIERIEAHLPVINEKTEKDRRAIYATGLAICLGFIILVI